MHTVPHIFALSGFAVLLAVAAVSDLRAFRIPNAISLAIAALFPLYIFTSDAPWSSGLLAAGLVFAVTTPMFFLGIFGGGDAKLLTATALWAGMTHLVPMLVVTTAIGCLLSVGIWLHHKFSFVSRLPVTVEGERAEIHGSLHVPYGVAIAAGGAYVAIANSLPLFGPLVGEPGGAA